MVPVWIGVVFFALVVYFTGADAARDDQVRVQAVADVSATNFLAYRSAARRYLVSVPAATGPLQDSQLSSFWPSGYVRNPQWGAVVEGGTLFVFSTDLPDTGLQSRLFELSRQSSLVGSKSATTGRLLTLSGLDTGINLPAVIPANAVVMVGS